MAKDTQTIRRLWLTNCLRVFDHFVVLALKVLSKQAISIADFAIIISRDTSLSRPFTTMCNIKWSDFP